MKPSDKLKEFIEKEIDEIPFDSGIPSYHVIQNIIRRLDVVALFSWDSDEPRDEELTLFKLYFAFGWAPLLKNYYDDIKIDVYQPFTLMMIESKVWVDSLVKYYGKLYFCKQLLAYEKAELIKISEGDKHDFYYEYLNKNNGIERFDRVSKNFFREHIVEKIIERKRKEKGFDKSRLLNELRSIIKSPDGKMISYNTTEFIDDYYNEEGYYQILRLQGHDDFGPTDLFGGIEYRKYVDIVELITGVALMHRDACMELINMNNNIDLHNVISHTYFKDKIIENYANYLEVGKSEMEQIFSCITLNKDNFEYYLEYPSTPAPMYFEVSDNLLIRSIAGCLGNPIDLLNRELKRKYRKGYDRAVNRREDRFRDELFGFFPSEQIIKIPREINVSFNGIKTDIDAVVFDTKNRTLGLFQLKWQDAFAHSMIERYSRMNNLFPKANEWIDKMRQWVDCHDGKSLLSSLQINKELKGNYEINEVCVFVLSRNQMNFTGMEDLDETVAWGSWHQLIESQSRIKTSSDDSIKNMFYKLKMLSPASRIDRDEVLANTEISFEMGEYSISYKSKS